MQYFSLAPRLPPSFADSRGLINVSSPSGHIVLQRHGLSHRIATSWIIASIVYISIPDVFYVTFLTEGKLMLQVTHL